MNRQRAGLVTNPITAALRLDHLTDEEERVGGWTEAAGGDGGALELTLPPHLWAGAGIVVVERRRLEVPAVKESACGNRRYVARFGRITGVRLARPPCGANTCAACRRPKAGSFGTTLVRVLREDDPVWMGFLKDQRTVEAFGKRVWRETHDMPSEQALSLKSPLVSSERSEGDLGDNARGVQIPPVPGFGVIGATRGFRRRWLAITNVDPNRDRRRKTGRRKDPMPQHDAQAAVNYAVRYIACVPVTYLSLSDAWREASEPAELTIAHMETPVGWTDASEKTPERPWLTDVVLPHARDDAYAVIKAAGFGLVERKGQLPDVVIPLHMTDEDAHGRLNAAVTAFYAARRKKKT